jgi:rhamnopyranosyl-N-acetylglucosaminyl-diphospho-decaprenol beta-1,3/1,4-galactofuranosyltransferase
MDKRICVVMVTYNRVEVLKTAVAHVLEQTVRPETIIIVDNNSSDGTKRYMDSLREEKDVFCIYLPSNIGYAGGIAQGMSYALSTDDYDYFWIMDDDTYYEKNALEELLLHMEGSPYDILGLNGSVIRWGIKRPPASADKLQEVDYVLIDGALLKATVVRKIGVPNEKFFMMCEDHEYCKRIKKYGYKVGLLNIGATRLHLGGDGSFTKATLWRGYYQSRNHILIIKEYFSFTDLTGYLIRQAKFIIAAALFAPDRGQRIRLRLVGMWHGLQGVDGKTLDPVTLKFTYPQ